ncbi:MAG TPA: hypothetical protein PLQ03_11570 [Brevundimonas sp.]|uniref:hypothetical protein n=1 Tax=Brevundimonas sp. TaxID=1871086 RepID=UPI00260E1463|nr:hypothetical protein [Brevundimonas sp.]HRO34037.1 hypothetical protein [Brevundimonas sp.]
MKSILLSSARKRPGAWGDWLKLEIGKGLVPPILFLGLRTAGLPVPIWLGAFLCIGAVVWMTFVLVTAVPAAFALNRRHQAYLDAAGIDQGWQRLIVSREAWGLARRDAPMRDVIALWRSERQAERRH